MNWFEILKGLYERGKIDTERLDSAVVKGLITADQYKEITGQDYTAP